MFEFQSVSELCSYISKQYNKIVQMTLKPWSGTNFEGVEPLVVIDAGNGFDICDLTNPTPHTHTSTHTHTHAQTVAWIHNKSERFRNTGVVLSRVWPINVNPSDKRLTFPFFGAGFVSAAPSCGTPDKLMHVCPPVTPLVALSPYHLAGTHQARHFLFDLSMLKTYHICLVDGFIY